MVERAPYRKRDEVREDILRATEDLLATRAPSEVTLRQIARHGGFQHSLITRHFGSKDELVAEVLQRTMQQYADAVRDTDDPVDGFMRGLEHVASHPASFQTMARALMDGSHPASSEGPFNAFSVHRGRLERTTIGGDLGNIDLDVLTVALMALTTGWAFTEDRWLRTAGYTDNDRARVRNQLSELIRRLVDDPHR
ncbi:MAG: TetR/AcrR family transcriptional regulator [Ilumatobacter sp.]|uniref:TetR/AcrR family transcriptional regulator n=1 Tax=Ilumatobacter sp. TaxID=1967498 RepID=UPI00391CF427